MTGKLKWGKKCSAKRGSLRDESSRDGGVYTVDFGSMTLSRDEVRGEKSKKGKRVTQQEEPSEMKAVIKRLASERNRGISRLLLSTGWSHTEGMKEEAGRQRSHIPLFSTQCLVLSSRVFTPLPEGIKVNMLAYPQLPHAGWAFATFISAPPPLHSPSIHPSFTPIIPLFLSSRSIASVIWYSPVWPGNTTAQICSVSLCISYLLCLTRRDKPVFITLPDLFHKSAHTNTHIGTKMARRHTHTPIREHQNFSSPPEYCIHQRKRFEIYMWLVLF